MIQFFPAFAVFAEAVGRIFNFQ